jgi:threonyl-tRNA synthetase
MASETESAENSEKLMRMRHSASHILAEAVKSIFPDAKLGIGPAIETGFYYDFELSRPLTPEDLPVIESKMKEIVKSNLPFRYEEVSKDKAREIFHDQPYKLELIDDIPDDKLGIYSQGSFVDLCRGPHVRYTSEVKAFKLTGIAGAYWKGDEKRPMLQRIYGIAFSKKQEVEDYLHKQEEAAKRDHRLINKQLNLYIAPEEIGSGLIIYGPKGGRIRSVIEEFWRQEHFKNGYEILYSPHIGLSKLWEISGHLENYKENMYSPIDIDDQKYYVKPMNCPFHILVYKSQMRSYRDLPLRWAELGTVYRYERSGVLMGLLRVRGFTQDDAHIFCTPEQINDEIAEVLRFSLYMWKVFGFDNYTVYLSTRPEKAIDANKEGWAAAESSLRQVLEKEGIPYKVDEGGGAFYGPKIDIKINDALGREWQMTTIQFDFNLPERFDMVYIGPDGKEHRPYMVHRALLGAWERFFGMIIEHYAGAFPVWISPVQAVVIPVSDQYLDYARKIESELKSADIRANLDDSSERMNQKIRMAQLDKVPCMLIVGEKEQSTDTVSVRLRTGKQISSLSIDEFKNRLLNTIADRVRDFEL